MTTEFTAPASWQGYLINGDPTGLSPDDRFKADKWLNWLGRGRPVASREVKHGKNCGHDARFLGIRSTVCYAYSFNRRAEFKETPPKPQLQPTYHPALAERLP